MPGSSSPSTVCAPHTFPFVCALFWFCSRSCSKEHSGVRYIMNICVCVCDARSMRMICAHVRHTFRTVFPFFHSRVCVKIVVSSVLLVRARTSVQSHWRNDDTLPTCCHTTLSPNGRKCFFRLCSPDRMLLHITLCGTPPRDCLFTCAQSQSIARLAKSQ